MKPYSNKAVFINCLIALGVADKDMNQSLTTMILDLQITKPVHCVVENSWATENTQ